jgi:hypothetical protein
LWQISIHTLKQLNCKSVTKFCGCPPPGTSMPPPHSLIIWHKYWDYIIILYWYHFLTELITEHVLLHIQTNICILIN